MEGKVKQVIVIGPHLICLDCWQSLGEPSAFGRILPPHEGCWCGGRTLSVYGTEYSSGVQCEDVHVHEMEQKCM